MAPRLDMTDQADRRRTAIVTAAARGIGSSPARSSPWPADRWTDVADDFDGVDAA